MIKIRIQVKLKSKKEGVEAPSDENDFYIVRVGTPPVDGKANKRIIELLAKHFKVSKSQVSLVAGDKSKLKTFAIKTP